MSLKIVQNKLEEYLLLEHRFKFYEHVVFIHGVEFNRIRAYFRVNIQNVEHDLNQNLSVISKINKLREFCS